MTSDIKTMREATVKVRKLSGLDTHCSTCGTMITVGEDYVTNHGKHHNAMRHTECARRVNLL